MSQPGREARLIKILQHNTPQAEQPAAGIGDDCAFLPADVPGGNLVVSTDTMSENIHYRHDWSSASDIAFKLYEMNASDLYAKGAVPRFCFLNLSLKSSTATEKFIHEFALSLGERLSVDNCLLNGGDITGSESDVFTLTLIGSVPEGEEYIARFSDRVQAGCQIYQLTESAEQGAGGSLYGLQALQSGRKVERSLLQPYLRPVAVRTRNMPGVIASIDQSDSLDETFKILARLYSAEIEIRLEEIVHPPLVDDYETVLASGEDFNRIVISECPVEHSHYHEIGCIRAIDSGHQIVEYRLENKPYRFNGTVFEHFNK